MDCSDAEFLTVEEGLCVQIMHIGSFDDEPATVAVMDKFLAENQSMCEADNRALQSGQNVSFQLIPEDFAKEIQDGSKATIRLCVMDSDGNIDEVQGEVYVDLFWGNKYKLNLSGNSDEGYFLGQ